MHQSNHASGNCHQFLVAQFRSRTLCIHDTFATRGTVRTIRKTLAAAAGCGLIEIATEGICRPGFRLSKKSNDLSKWHPIWANRRRRIATLHHVPLPEALGPNFAEGFKFSYQCLWSEMGSNVARPRSSTRVGSRFGQFQTCAKSGSIRAWKPAVQWFANERDLANLLGQFQRMSQEQK